MQCLPPSSTTSSLEVPLLTARWRNLVLVNYTVEPRTLAPFVPRGTELDFHGNETFLSLVGFLFERTRLAGCIPLGPLATFEEINLRFYVQRVLPQGVRRAVCFVREVVPFSLVAWGARVLYQEPYVRCRTDHRWDLDDPGAAESGGRFSYAWESGGRRFELAARTSGPLVALRPGSFEEFILDHPWGYTSLRDGRTREYRIAHPRWPHWGLQRVDVSPEIAAFYPPVLAEALGRPPHSALIAAGSQVSVFRGRRIPAT